MLTGLIFGVIAIVWIAYLTPGFLSRRGSHHGLSSAVIDSFADNMQVVRHSGAEDVSYLQDSGARVSTPATRRAARHRIVTAQRIAVRRRRIGMNIALVVLVAGIVVPFLLPVSHLWTIAPTCAFLAWLGLSRWSVVTLERALASRRAEVVFCDEEPTVNISEMLASQVVEELSSDAGERSVEITGPIHETLGSLWEPIPVAPTTYVSKPLLPRSVRTIDLSAPVASRELRFPVDGDTPSDAYGEQPALPGIDDAQDLPPAVGE